MRVVQLSDFHLEPAGTLAYGVADTLAHTRAAIAHIQALPEPPDAIVITGDIASSGKIEAYALVRPLLDSLARSGTAVYVLPGNHDHRGRMLEYLGPYCPADAATAPQLCYSVDLQPLRLVMLDTMRPGSHSGHLEPAVARWLDASLAAAPTRPTLLFTHHPPFLSGMGVMDEAFENQGLFADILRRHPQVRLCCGHMHRGFSTLWAERLCLCAPSTAMQIALRLTPEGGDDFVMEAPGYALHHWDAQSQQLNSHFCQIPCTPTYSGPHPFAGVVNPAE